MKIIHAATIAALALGGGAILAQTTSATKVPDPGEGAKLIVSYCSPCHDWASDYNSIMSSGVFVPGKSGSSMGWLLIASGQMPASGPAPSAEEQQVIKDWIDAGAPEPKNP